MSGACSAAHSVSSPKLAIKKIVSIVSIVFKPPQGSLAAKGLARAFVVRFYREPFVVQSPKKRALSFKGSRPEACRLAQRVAAHGRIARVGLLAVGVASAVSAVGSVGLQLVHTLDGGIELKA